MNNTQSNTHKKIWGWPTSRLPINSIILIIIITIIGRCVYRFSHCDFSGCCGKLQGYSYSILQIMLVYILYVSNSFSIIYAEDMGCVYMKVLEVREGEKNSITIPCKVMVFLKHHNYIF